MQHNLSHAKAKRGGNFPPRRGVLFTRATRHYAYLPACKRLAFVYIYRTPNSFMMSNIFSRVYGLS